MSTRKGSINRSAPIFYGGLRRFPRDDSLQTPPGPEGSNGSE